MKENPKLELVNRFKEIYLKYLESNEKIFFQDDCIVINNPEYGVRGKIDNYYFFIYEKNRKEMKVRFEKVSLRGRIFRNDDGQNGTLRVFMDRERYLDISISKRGKIKELESPYARSNTIDILAMEMPDKVLANLYGKDVLKEAIIQNEIDEQYKKHVYGSIDKVFNQYKKIKNNKRI